VLLKADAVPVYKEIYSGCFGNRCFLQYDIAKTAKKYHFAQKT